ncbi:MAG: hydrogenase maturation protease [Chloroflexi bacterium]|nr:hydrogenase maturation protease [Chloroflexota bacterium]
MILWLFFVGFDMVGGMETLLIGYGNPLRGDDGVGWRVIEEINHFQSSIVNGQWGGPLTPHSALRTPQLIAVHQLLPELAEPISEAELVIFVDASVEGEPGAVQVQAVTPRPQQPGAFSHHFDPAGLLAYAGEVYGRCPPAYLVTVTAVSLGYAEILSPTVAAALPEVLAEIQSLISQTLA